MRTGCFWGVSAPAEARAAQPTSKHPQAPLAKEPVLVVMVLLLQQAVRAPHARTHSAPRTSQGSGGPPASAWACMPGPGLGTALLLLKCFTGFKWWHTALNATNAPPPLLTFASGRLRALECPQQHPAHVVMMSASSSSSTAAALLDELLLALVGFTGDVFVEDHADAGCVWAMGNAVCCVVYHKACTQRAHGAAHPPPACFGPPRTASCQPAAAHMPGALCTPMAAARRPQQALLPHPDRCAIHLSRDLAWVDTPDRCACSCSAASIE